MRGLCACHVAHCGGVVSHFLCLQALVFCLFSFMLEIAYHFRFATEMHVCEVVLLKFCHPRRADWLQQDGLRHRWFQESSLQGDVQRDSQHVSRLAG